MENLLWTALFIPLVSFLVQLFLPLPRKVVALVGPFAILASFCCFVALYFANISFETTLFTWISLPYLYANFALHYDALSMLMTLIITGVGFLIHAYSVGYMDHERDLRRYFAVMNFFIFSMLLLVLAQNLLLLFVGWEGVGLASYLLIGFWYEKRSAEEAAKKAFVVNRIGDLGLLLGIFLTFALFGTSDIAVVTKSANSGPILILLCLLYFWGASGKSAQIPLHTWLPDAMEGPTPVSALIHAATMVTAGVYLVVRMSPLFTLAPFARDVIALIGGITAIYSALSATSQRDIKRVLAYSTLSQLGLMFLACGFGAYTAAMFHLTMHAFVKALLFLSAGNVIHMLRGVQELSEMGGLSKYLKKTNICFFVGVLSLGGIPPLAIFFSKDLILEDISSSTPYYILGLIVSLLTAYYLMRAYTMAFWGTAKNSAEEAPSIMLLPVAILCILSIVGGMWLANSFGFHAGSLVWISIAVAVAGILLGMINRKTLEFFYKAFYIDQLYETLFVLPLKKLSSAIASIIEPKVFDGVIDYSGDASYKAAALLQKIQTGRIRSYIAWIIVGTSFVICYLVYEGFI